MFGNRLCFESWFRGVLLLALLPAGWFVVACDDEDESDARPSATATMSPQTVATSPTSSPTVPATASVETARAKLKNEGASLDIVDAAIAGDVNKLLRYGAMTDAVCTAPTDHGETPLCFPLGLPAGTPIRVAPVGSTLPTLVPEAYLQQYFTSALSGKGGRLSFAAKADGLVVVGISFPPINRPLTGLGDDPIEAFVFEIAPQQSPPITTTFILIRGVSPRAAFNEEYAGRATDVWHEQ